MFGIGMPEMLLLLAVALIVFGPKKLPELAKSMGRALGEFKRATSEIKDNIEEQTGLGEVRDSLNEVKQDIRAQVDLGVNETTASDKAQSPKKGAKDQAPLSQVKDAFDALNAAPQKDNVTEPPPKAESDPTENPDEAPRENSST